MLALRAAFDHVPLGIVLLDSRLNARFINQAFRRMVRGVEFEVTSGEVFCLLGPNGAGKTTTVEILEGFRRSARAENVDRVRPAKCQRDTLAVQADITEDENTRPLYCFG